MALHKYDKEFALTLDVFKILELSKSIPKELVFTRTFLGLTSAMQESLLQK